MCQPIHEYNDCEGCPKTCEDDIRELRNVLVQYKGGGYDGCMWEWNYAYFDKDGKFHSIWHSGHSGCDSEEKMLLHLKRESGCYLYDLDKKEDWEEFETESNAGHVIGVARWLYNNTEDDPLITCDICKEKHSIDDMRPDGLEGAGGIAVQYTLKVCESCNCDHSCCSCGEFFEDNSAFDEEGDCEYCQEEHAKA